MSSVVAGQTAQTMLSVSFSGGGHLLPYHLGVASYFLRHVDVTPQQPSAKAKLQGRTNSIRLRDVSGSSSGAIAATVFSMLPHRIEEYTERFVDRGGGGISLLREMLACHTVSAESNNDDPPECSVVVESVQDHQHRTSSQQSSKLLVATTKCIDGSLQLFPFDVPALKINHGNVRFGKDTLEKLMVCVEASCRIPRSFHPTDTVRIVPSMPFFNKQTHYLSYPNSEGVLIDGEYYVDGGIAAPCPPTTTTTPDMKSPIIHSNNDRDQSNHHLIKVSPFSNGFPTTSLQLPHVGSHTDVDGTSIHVCPKDSSFRLLPLPYVTCGAHSGGTLKVRPSLQNLRALRVSLGAANKDELKDWFQRGKDDAERVLEFESKLPRI